MGQQLLHMLLVLLLSAQRYRALPAAGTEAFVVPGDVRLYDADPADDGGDDTAALRRALANCSATGGQVYFPSGVYTI
eukprot:COSAG05_NODE_10472_length_563_cov_0.946121_1_plen_77_part_10